jgi:5'-3' exoribonuclease 2
MSVNGTDYVAVTPSTTARGGALHPSLPSRPGFDLVPVSQVVKKLTHVQEAESLKKGLATMEAVGSSNQDLVNNRKAIRMANMSAAQMLKAELEGTTPVEGTADQPADVSEEIKPDVGGGMDIEEAKEILEEAGEEVVDDVDGDDNGSVGTEIASKKLSRKDKKNLKRKARSADSDVEVDASAEADAADSELEAPPNPDADQPVPKKKLKVNPNGTVEYEDDVRLWEPGYRERYYRQKFGIELSDKAFIKQ